MPTKRDNRTGQRLGRSSDRTKLSSDASVKADRNCQTCGDQGLPGEPVRGQEEVFAQPIRPQPRLSSGLSDAVASLAFEKTGSPGNERREFIQHKPADRLGDEATAEDVSEVIQFLSGKGEVETRHLTLRATGEDVQTPYSEGVIHDNMLDDTSTSAVQHLPRLGAPWVESNFHVVLTEGKAENGDSSGDVDEAFPNDTPKDDVKEGYDDDEDHWPVGHISDTDDPHAPAPYPCDENTLRYFRFSIFKDLVVTHELEYWADANVKGDTVRYPDGTIVEQRPPASNDDHEDNIENFINIVMRTIFDDTDHYKDGIPPMRELDDAARKAFRAHEGCSEKACTDKGWRCIVEVKILRRLIDSIREVGRDIPPKWRRGSEEDDYEWEDTGSGFKRLKRRRIYVTFKFTLSIFAKYWVSLKCRCE